MTRTRPTSLFEVSIREKCWGGTTFKGVTEINQRSAACRGHVRLQEARGCQSGAARQSGAAKLLHLPCVDVCLPAPTRSAEFASVAENDDSPSFLEIGIKGSSPILLCPATSLYPLPSETCYFPDTRHTKLAPGHKLRPTWQSKIGWCLGSREEQEQNRACK